LRRPLRALVSSIAFANSAAAYADTIPDSESTIASGSVNGQVFTNSLATVKGSADTSEIVFESGSLLVSLPSAQVTVAGFGTFDFPDSIEFLVFQDTMIGGANALGALVLDDARDFSFQATTSSAPTLEPSGLILYVLLAEKATPSVTNSDQRNEKGSSERYRREDDRRGRLMKERGSATARKKTVPKDGQTRFCSRSLTAWKGTCDALHRPDPGCRCPRGRGSRAQVQATQRKQKSR
jgi:hypothetical protein